MVPFLRQTCGTEEWPLSCFKQRIVQPLYDSTARVLAWMGLTRTHGGAMSGKKRWGRRG